MANADFTMCYDESDLPPDPTADDHLLAAYRDGDEAAFAALFDRYSARLRKLAQAQMGPLLREVEESSDVAQSVWQSVFRRTLDGTIELGPQDSLWPLLAKITVNKVRNRAKHWARKRRDRRRHVSLEDCDPLVSNPTHEHVTETNNLVQELLDAFDEKRQEVIKYILRDLPIPEIARRMGTSKRTIYRIRLAAMHILEQKLFAS